MLSVLRGVNDHDWSVGLVPEETVLINFQKNNPENVGLLETYINGNSTFQKLKK